MVAQGPVVTSSHVPKERVMRMVTSVMVAQAVVMRVTGGRRCHRKAAGCSCGWVQCCSCSRCRHTGCVRVVRVQRIGVVMMVTHACQCAGILVVVMGRGEVVMVMVRIQMMEAV